MAAPPPPPPPLKGGLSLYDDLLDPNEKSAATISSAPVRYNNQSSDTTAEASSAQPKKPIDPSLRFQPIRRPQLKTAKPKSSPKPPPILGPAPTATDTSNTSATAQPQQQQKSTLADWAAREEDEWLYGTGEKRQRGGRKKKKKQQHPIDTDWDDIYDPSRPTNVDEYLRSDEKIDEVREWKALLYRHRREREQHSDLSDDSEVDSRPLHSNQFAPPASYNFAPPPPPSPPPVPDALPPPAPSEFTRNDSSTISAAPIRYIQNSHEHADSDKEEDSYSPPPAITTSSPPPQTSLPGQAGFASRLMKKYGWTSGTGLGASSSGIINPLHVKVEKRKKRSDAEGGGWAEPANKGKILGGQRAKADLSRDAAEGRGKMSEVIVLENMLENMPDLQEEISAGLGQEIGEECGEKYGRVERLYIDQERRLVFIKFTDQISALRAVSDLDGRVFNGNTIVPKYYDSDKFEQGIYG